MLTVALVILGLLLLTALAGVVSQPRKRKYCPFCGRKIDSLKKCPYCGENVESSK